MKKLTSKTVKAEKPVEKKAAAKTVKTAEKKAAPKAVPGTADKTPKKTLTPKVAKDKVASVKAPEKKVVKKGADIPVKMAEKKAIHKKLKLTKSQRKLYFDLLMTARGEFMEQLKFHSDEALSSKKDAAGERAGMATHMADLGSDNFRHDLELGLLSDEGDVVEMIDEALHRLEENEYGICLDCGCEINPERLEAKPYARYCTKCKSKREELEEPHKRSR